MSRNYFYSNKDSDSEAEIARRRNFIERMERKLEYKELVAGPTADSGRI